MLLHTVPGFLVFKLLQADVGFFMFQKLNLRSFSCYISKSCFGLPKALATELGRKKLLFIIYSIIIYPAESQGTGFIPGEAKLPVKGGRISQGCSHPPVFLNVSRLHIATEQVLFCLLPRVPLTEMISCVWRGIYSQSKEHGSGETQASKR